MHFKTMQFYVTLNFVHFLSECDGGTFGENCMTPCHCLNDKPCDHISGSCPDNSCAPGWKSNNCSKGSFMCQFYSNY